MRTKRTFMFCTSEKDPMKKFLKHIKVDDLLYYVYSCANRASHVDNKTRTTGFWRKSAVPLLY